MRRLLFVLLWVFLGVQIVDVCPALAQSPDERAIRALIDRTIQGNNSVDEKVVKQSMTDMGTNAGPFFPPFTASVGTATELDRLVSRILALVSARSFTVTGPMTVRAEKNVGWANYTWRADVTFKDGTQRSFDGRTTATFVREGKTWKYAHWHSSLAAPFPVTSKEREVEGQAILKIERDAWEAAKNKQLNSFVDYFAEDASIFSESQAYRLRGRADIMRDLEASFKQVDLQSYQILDPQVQVLGDTALLTYYFTESGVRDGKSFTNSGKISMLFMKQDGKWRALHEHISATK